MSSENQLSEMETLFLALADQTRLRLLNLMREDEVCVCYFTEVLGESQPKISRHLAYLRNAEVVSARREGKWMNYSIQTPENPQAAKLLQETLDWLKTQEDLQADFQRLANFCCAVDVPVTIARAPTPKTFLEPEPETRKNQELETFLL